MRNRFDSAASNINTDHNHGQRSPATGSQAFLRVLVTAEHEAQQIVNAAKADRVAILQQAKQESEIEVAGLRAEMEIEFQKILAESTGDSGANMKRLEQDAEIKINRLKLEADKVRDDIISMLLQHVTTVSV